MFQKLVSGGPNQRNWRGILIALLVIIAVLALIVTSVVLLTPPDEGPRVKGRRLKIQDLLTNELVPARWNGTWISGEFCWLLLQILLFFVFLSYLLRLPINCHHVILLLHLLLKEAKNVSDSTQRLEKGQLFGIFS